MSNIDPNEFQTLVREVEGLRGDVKELVDAWKTARGVVRFVRLLGNITKWAAGVVAAVMAVWALIKMGYRP